MTIYNYLKNLYAQFHASPDAFKAYINNVYSYIRGCEYAAQWSSESRPLKQNQEVQTIIGKEKDNPLIRYFRNNVKGPGIWKWEHYFDVYHRHFHHLVNNEVKILEIGVYSGGSMNMWRSYFGPQSHIYGVDIEPACKCYEREGVTIMIGDQKNRAFWKAFRDQVPGVDVLIDDGGHKPEQQMVTLEEMLPHIRPGGVYLCEDIHGLHHSFISFAAGLVSELNRSVDQGAPAGMQRHVHSIHFYPYLLVIEKHEIEPLKFHAPKYGTEWQPFFDKINSNPGVNANGVDLGRVTQ